MGAWNLVSKVTSTLIAVMHISEYSTLIFCPELLSPTGLRVRNISCPDKVPQSDVYRYNIDPQLPSNLPSIPTMNDHKRSIKGHLGVLEGPKICRC